MIDVVDQNEIFECPCCKAKVQGYELENGSLFEEEHEYYMLYCPYCEELVVDQSDFAGDYMEIQSNYPK